MLPPTKAMIGTARTTAAFASQPGAQLVLLLLLTSSMSLEEVGHYFIITPLSAVLSELVGLGYSEAFIAERSRSLMTANHAVRGVIVRICQTIIPACIVGAVATNYVSDTFSVSLLFLIYILDISGVRILSSTEHLLVGLRRFELADVVRALGPVGRVVGVVFFITAADTDTGSGAALAGAAGTFFTAACLFAPLYFTIGPRDRSRLLPLKTTFPYALNQFSRSAQQNLDRFALALVVTPEQVAIYSVANRLAMAALLPVQATMRNYYPEFFKYGRRGLRPVSIFARNRFAGVAAISSLCSFFILIGSFFLPFVFGTGYAPAANVTRWMALLPLFWGGYYLVANVLSGVGGQLHRSVISVIAVVLQSAVLILLAIPLGLKGAVAAQYFGVAASIGLTFLILHRWTASDKGKQ